jgi:hypothetical protein
MSDNFSRARDVLVNAIRPALLILEKGGLASEQLVLGTGIQESLLQFRQQIGGPALGLFQMEPATHDDCWENFLRFRDSIAAKVRQTLDAGQRPVADTIKVNDRYAAAMCRIRYLRVSAPMPAANDIQALAAYWKQHYNTPLGAGTPQQLLDKWPLFVNSDTFS